MARYLIGNIKGPKGDQGPAGPAGPTYTAGEGISIENNVISATGSGGITTETDPVFSASPAATITSADIADWNAKSEFSGSYNDLTNKPDLSQYATQTQLGTGLARKQDTLTAGDNITITNNVISATGGSAAGIYELTDFNLTGKDDLLAMFANDNPPEVILYQNKYYKIVNRLQNFSNSDVFNYNIKYDKNPIMGPEFLQFRCSLDYSSFTAIAIQNADELNGNLVTVQSAPADKFPNASSKNLAQLFTSIGNNYATKTYVDNAVAGAGGGTTYTAGEGLQIDGNDVISVDTDVVPLKADLAYYATQTQLTNGLATKQDTLTAGTNISIDNNVISATDTTYTAGLGIDIAGSTINVDNSVVALKSDIPAVNTYGDADVADFISDTFGMGVSQAQPTLWGQTSDPQYLNEDSQAEIVLEGSDVTNQFTQGSVYQIEFELQQNSDNTVVETVNELFTATSVDDKGDTVFCSFTNSNNTISLHIDYWGETWWLEETSFSGYSDIGYHISNFKVYLPTSGTVKTPIDEDFIPSTIARVSDIPANELPVYAAGDIGKVLTVNSGGVEWATPASGGNEVRLISVNNITNTSSFTSEDISFLWDALNSTNPFAKPFVIVDTNTKMTYRPYYFENGTDKGISVSAFGAYFQDRMKCMAYVIRFNSNGNLWFIGSSSGLFGDVITISSQNNPAGQSTNLNNSLKYIKDNYATKAEIPTLPTAPAADGTYFLTTTVSSGTATQSWVTIPAANGNNF